MKSEMFITHPNVCLTVMRRITFLTKSDLDNYIGKHVYRKNHRKKNMIEL